MKVIDLVLALSEVDPVAEVYVEVEHGGLLSPVSVVGTGGVEIYSDGEWDEFWCIEDSGATRGHGAPGNVRTEQGTYLRRE